MLLLGIPLNRCLSSRLFPILSYRLQVPRGAPVVWAFICLHFPCWSADRNLLLFTAGAKTPHDLESASVEARSLLTIWIKLLDSGMLCAMDPGVGE
jgi:hypothetical protein